MMILEYMAVGSAKLLQCLKQNVMIVCNTAKLSVFTISCSQSVSQFSESYKKACLSLHHLRQYVAFLVGACLTLSFYLSFIHQGGDLMRAVTNDKTNELRWSRKGGLLMMDIARGLAFLHANKVCQLPPLPPPPSSPCAALKPASFFGIIPAFCQVEGTHALNL